MSDIYTYEPQDLDLKESIKLRTDCSQLDTITLQFNIYNYDIAVDLSNFNIEFRGIKPDGNLYSQAESITKVGNLLTINCSNELTSVIGRTTCEIRIYDNVGNQKSSYFIVINVSGLVSDSDRIVSRTLIDSVEHLDNSINRAIDINNHFDNNIEEANTVSDTLATTTSNASALNSSLETKNNTATTNITNLTTQNNNATSNISTLTTKNSEAVENIADLTTQNNNASTNLANFEAIDTNNIVNTLASHSTQLSEIVPNTTLWYLESINNFRTRAIVSAQGFYDIEEDAYGKYRVLMVDGSETWIVITDGTNSFKISSNGEIASNKELTTNDKKLKFIPKHGKIDLALLGAKGDGVKDDTVIIQIAINFATLNNFIITSSKQKIYGISNSLTISDELDIDFNGATIKAISTVADMIIINNSQYITNYTNGYNHYNRLNNINFDCNNLATNVFHFVYGAKFDLSKIKIRNLIGIGIKIDAGYEILCSGIDIVGDGSDTSQGIVCNTSDCHFTDIIMVNCHKAIVNSGTNFYTRVHAWLTKNFYQSIFFSHNGGTPFLLQCYSDTYYISIKKMTGSRITINQLNVFFNTTLYTTSTCNYSPYVFYFEQASGDSTSLSAYSRFVQISNSTIKAHKDIATYLTNLAINTSFVQSENNFIYSDGVAILDLNQNNTSKLTLENIASDNNTSIGLLNSIKIRNGKALCELKLYFSSGIAVATDVLIGHVTTAFAKFSGDKVIPVLLSDGAWGGSNCGIGSLHFTADNNGSLYVKHNITGWTPKYLMVSFEYEVGYYA
jgi:hypothetical protein